MTNFRKKTLLQLTAISLFFILHFVYFLVFNCYHLAYQEQIQLFRFDLNFFSGFLSKPGGLSLYLGEFLTQLYLYSWSGALIVTMAGIALYTLAGYIFRQHGLTGMVWAFIPVMLLAALQSNHNYIIGYTLGLLFILSFFAIYISIRNDKIRYVTGFAGFPLLYIVTGSYSLIAVLLYIIHEIIFRRNAYRLGIAAAYIIISLVIPYLAWRYVYFINPKDAWLYPIPFHIKAIVKYDLYLLLVYFPFVLVIVSSRLRVSKKTEISFGWNWKTTVTGTIVLIALAILLKEQAYDYKTELILGIDISVQKAKWQKALKLSDRYPEINRLVTYYTNLALYKSGQLADRMFDYNQIGGQGLRLKWQRNNIIPFFGGEIYYHLAYINEAYRWAFEALETNGLNPRSLKRLVITSIVNNDYAIAEKHLNVLDQTLFYRNWAEHYRKYLNEEKLLEQNTEISEKRNLTIHSDFWADRENFEVQLLMLLNNHPNNRMAFEYYMAYLLLEKNIDSFMANIDQIKNLGYKRIPVHYEEALLVYMSYTRNNVIPQGYSINAATRQRFNDYISRYTQYKSNSNITGQTLYEEFGNTYWFYLHFYNLPGKAK
jgi:hypothetical protein